MFETSLSAEYEMAARELQLKREDLVSIALQGVDAAFCPVGEKETLKDLIRAYATNKDV